MSMLPRRRTSPFRALAVALVLMFASALVPLSRSRIRHDVNSHGSGSAPSARIVEQAEASPYLDRVRTHLDGLRAQGYVVQQPMVFMTGHQESKERTWLDRLFSLEAEEYWTGNGVAVLTLIDGGDPNIAEWAVYVNNFASGTELWATQAVSRYAPGSPWSWGEYLSIPGVNARNADGNALDKVCAALSPELNAMPPVFCTDTWSGATRVLRNSFANAAVNTGGAAFWCAGATLGYGGCIAANFFGSFAASLIWESISIGAVCRDWW